MIGFLKNLKSFGTSMKLRTKLITGFVTVTILLSAVNMVSHSIMQNTVRKLDNMIQVTITANDMITSVKDIGTILSNYILF